LRVAVSGSHGTGKSTLIAAFLEEHPVYLHEPEAFESLADEIELTPDEGPAPQGLGALLQHSIAKVSLYQPGASVLFERSPVDYLAYAAASERSWPSGAIASFLETAVPDVRDAVRYLDMIVFLPVASRGIPPREGEDPRFRKRVDAALRRALFDDEYELFGESTAPRVVELSPFPERQVKELVHCVRDGGGSL
jgi:predicted ATPase